MRALIAAAALVAVASPSWAAAALDLDARMREHIDWLTEHSDLEYGGEPLPLVLQDTPRGLQITRYGMEMVLQAEAEGSSTALLEIGALYDTEQNVMFLRDDFDPERDDYILVHELVHFLHVVNETPFDCLAASEREAYGLQAEWQDAHDDPNPRPDGFTIVMLSSCGWMR